MDRLNAKTHPAGRNALPVRALQFGEGVFLRAFVEELFDDLINQNLFDGSIAIVQPRPGKDKLRALAEQDGLYTLITRGLQNGIAHEQSRIINCISQAIDPYTHFDAYKSLCTSAALRYVVSNTTEAGIAYKDGESMSDAPCLSFPAKITQLLHWRYEAFNGAPGKGLVFLPCELIEHNGTALKQLALRHANEWGLSGDFMHWVESCCTFANTLVDRIVSGYPKSEAEAICAQLGYEDALLDVAEPYSLFAIEGADELKTALSIEKAALNVVLTNDLAPFRTRKVRILNGAHTALVPVALLMGQRFVNESLAHPLLRNYLSKLLQDEVIPAMDGDAAELKIYAQSVFDRFENPFLAHALTSIALNTASKWRTRLLPSLLDHQAKFGKLPPLITFAFAAATACEVGTEGIDELEAELTSIPGFASAVQSARKDIHMNGCREALEARL